MSKRSNFNNPDLDITGRVQYNIGEFGKFSSNNVFTYTDNIKVASNDDSDCFYAGEPVKLEVNNGELFVKTVTDTTTDLDDVTFDAVVVPYYNTFLNAVDKSNKNIGYKLYDKSENMQVCRLKGERIKIKCTESLAPKQEVTFAFDANGVLCVAPAVAGNKIYGYCVNTKTIDQYDLAVIEFDFSAVKIKGE